MSPWFRSQGANMAGAVGPTSLSASSGSGVPLLKKLVRSDGRASWWCESDCSSAIVCAGRPAFFCGDDDLVDIFLSAAQVVVQNKEKKPQCNQENAARRREKKRGWRGWGEKREI